MGNAKGYKAPTLTGEQRAEVAARYAERYDAGETLRALSVESGRSYGAIHALLVEGGATLRTRGVRKGSPGTVVTRRSTEGAEDAYGSPDPDFDVDAELARYDFSFIREQA